MADVSRIEYNQTALRALATGADLQRFVGDLGQQVADRGNAKAATLFNPDPGGGITGGIGSLRSDVSTDDKGVVAKITYPPEHFYMWIGELGSEHQRPRPHVRPALFATRRATGGKTSAIKSIRQDKAAKARTTRTRASARARRQR